MNQEGVGGDQTTSSKALTGGRHTHKHTREREGERGVKGAARSGSKKQETQTKKRSYFLLSTYKKWSAALS